jgi:hypothetical protein
MGKMISRAVGITVTANMARHPKIELTKHGKVVLYIYIYIYILKKQLKSNQAENSYLNSPKSKKKEWAIETKSS